MPVIRAFRSTDLAAVIGLCTAEGWPSWSTDPERTERALTAPGVHTVVAEIDGEVIGFAQMLGDGEIIAYLGTLAVAPAHRRLGVARDLVRAAARSVGVERVDLLSTDQATGFYASFPHKRKPGFRVYPLREEDA